MATLYFDESNFIIGNLIDKNFLSNIDAVQIENILGLSAGKRYSSMSFVGIIEASDNVFFVYPKFFIEPISNKGIVTKLIIELMLRISSENVGNNRLSDSHLFEQKKNINNLSRIGLAKYLLDDFYSHGLLSIKQSYFKKSQSRNPNWEKTIQSIDPLHSQSGPLYDIWVSRHTERVDHQFITEMHRVIISHCSKIYGELIGYPCDALLGPYSSDYVNNSSLSILKMAMRRTFSLRENQVLGAIVAWIEEDKGSGIKLFGTQNFHVIWERICATLFCDIKNSDDWVDVMPYPHWMSWENSLISYPQGKFQLDVLSELPNRKGLLLIDAKYYQLKIENGKVLSGPGVGDVSKQLHYESLVYTSATFIKNFGCDRTKLINCFVFPVAEANGDLIPFGEISIPRITSNRIVCVNLSGVSAIQRYLHRQPFTDSELTEFYDAVIAVPHCYI